MLVWIEYAFDLNGTDDRSFRSSQIESIASGEEDPLATSRARFEVGSKEEKTYLISIMAKPGATLRMKKKYYNSKAKSDPPYDPLAPVLKGCKAYDQRPQL